MWYKKSEFHAHNVNTLNLAAILRHTKIVHLGPTLDKNVFLE